MLQLIFSSNLVPVDGGKSMIFKGFDKALLQFNLRTGDCCVTEKLHRAQIAQADTFACAQVKAFKFGNSWRVLITSYELVRKFCSELAGSIDLLICDEGHRLKSSTLSSTMKVRLSEFDRASMP